MVAIGALQDPEKGNETDNEKSVDPNVYITKEAMAFAFSECKESLRNILKGTVFVHLFVAVFGSVILLIALHGETTAPMEEAIVRIIVYFAFCLIGVLIAYGLLSSDVHANAAAGEIIWALNPAIWNEYSDSKTVKCAKIVMQILGFSEMMLISNLSVIIFNVVKKQIGFASPLKIVREMNASDIAQLLSVFLILVALDMKDVIAWKIAEWKSNGAAESEITETEKAKKGKDYAFAVTPFSKESFNYLELSFVSILKYSVLALIPSHLIILAIQTALSMLDKKLKNRTAQTDQQPEKLLQINHI